jgi:hypothetical protein
MVKVSKCDALILHELRIQIQTTLNPASQLDSDQSQSWEIVADRDRGQFHFSLNSARLHPFIQSEHGTEFRISGTISPKFGLCTKSSKSTKHDQFHSNHEKSWKSDAIIDVLRLTFPNFGNTREFSIQPWTGRDLKVMKGKDVKDNFSSKATSIPNDSFWTLKGRKFELLAGRLRKKSGLRGQFWAIERTES